MDYNSFDHVKKNKGKFVEVAEKADVYILAKYMCVAKLLTKAIKKGYVAAVEVRHGKSGSLAKIYRRNWYIGWCVSNSRVPLWVINVGPEEVSLRDEAKQERCTQWMSYSQRGQHTNKAFWEIKCFSEPCETLIFCAWSKHHQQNLSIKSMRLNWPENSSQSLITWLTNTLTHLQTIGMTCDALTYASI